MKHKFIVAYFILALATFSIARVFQILFLLEPVTGFYKAEYGRTNLVYVTFYIGMVIILGAFAFSTRRMPTHAPKVDKLLSVISFVVAISFAISSGVNLVNGFSSTKFLSAMFSLLAAVFFVIYGLSGISDIKVPPVVSLFVFPVWGFRLVSSFISFTGMANITENIYDILMFCASLFFFILMAKILSGVYVIRSIHYLYPVGLITSLLCIICSIPRYFVVLIGREEMLHKSTTLDISVLATGIFIAVFTLKLYSKNNLDKRLRSTKTIDYNGMNAKQMSQEYITERDEQE